MVPASGESWRHRGKVGLCADVKDKVHADHNVEKKVTVEEPIAGIVGSEAHHDVTIVGHGNCIL